MYRARFWALPRIFLAIFSLKGVFSKKDNKNLILLGPCSTKYFYNTFCIKTNRKKKKNNVKHTKTEKYWDTLSAFSSEGRKHFLEWTATILYIILQFFVIVRLSN